MMENIDLVGQFWQSMCDAAQNVGAQTEFDRDLAETVHAAAGLVAQVLTSTLGIRLASQKFLSLACLCFAGAPMARGAYRTLQRKRWGQRLPLRRPKLGVDVPWCLMLASTFLSQRVEAGRKH